ncbi:MAG: chemotaxis protein CheB, partial [Campylobacterota bacterium]|nr:chemotaxis protein CheB [Campylobacterota bacterium]
MIHYEQYGTITKILIENGCSKSDELELLKLLKEKDKLSISFITTSIVSPEIVKSLINTKKDLKLTTDDKILWSYLRKLSINIALDKIYHYKHNNNEIKAIGIGGSAGALQNIIKIVKELPYSDIAVFIVVHILPNETNKLASILQQFTSFRVKEAENGEKVRLNHIYVTSPNLHMNVVDGYIYQTSEPKVNFSRPSIDVLFKTLNLEYKENLLTILTCGYLDDGINSLKDIKETGGIAIVQDPNECEANEIPLNAIISGNYTEVFNIEQINEYIKAKLNAIINLEDRVRKLLKNINKIYGYDFSDYDIKSISRRVELVRQELRIDIFIEFENVILNNREIFELLFKKISINVSDFFRDPEVFKHIRGEVLPILKTYPHIKVWCSACSSGEEPYSVAIMLDEMGLLDRSIIYATDFNNNILNQAKNGMFSKKSYKQYKENYIKSGGKKDFDSWFEITDNYVELNSKIKDKLNFFQHNLVTDGVFNEFHLVFCRNVLIYFDKKLKNNVIKLINDSL